MRLPKDQGWNIPFDSPFYPPLPAHYRQAQFQYLFFRANPQGVSRLLPEPLQAAPDGLCVAIGIHVPFCTSYGSFSEAVVAEQCLFQGQLGWYTSHVWHTGPSGIAAGREIYGTPKIFAAVEVRLVDRTMTTRAAMGGLPVITLSSTLEQPVAASTMPALIPAWRLKIVPRADGPGPALKQLIDCTSATQDFQAHVCLQGRGVVQFQPSPLCNVTCLEPQAYLDAFLATQRLMPALPTTT
ncbi:MAG: acetoacetate decarboxylase family protein [Deinococcus sp.]|nr:acetoacetate decarboxylase family protein [Deinococcus sp.]